MWITWEEKCCLLLLISGPGQLVLSNSLPKGTATAGKLTIWSTNLGAELTLDGDALDKPYNDELFKAPDNNPWKLYVCGVLKELKAIGVPFCPANVAFGGNVPMGSGLSSSASLCVSLAAFFLRLAGKDDAVDQRGLAKLTRAVEVNALGANIGIMDEMASIFGKKNQFIELNCDTLEVEYHPIAIQGYTWILINSMHKHSVGDGAYNKLRAGMEEVLAVVNEGENRGKDGLLVDLDVQTLQKYQSKVDEEKYQMALYVVEETARTKQFVKAMGDGDVDKVGELLLGTHDGLANKLKISTEEVEFIVDKCKESKQCKGGRMMGAGFGGCVLAVVHSPDTQGFITELQASFKAKYGIDPEVYPALIGDGQMVEGP
eukprot:TRINITY_DN52343_c0_g1_i1.p1 TRINITY_DN52343_c0_g1~~TRINITY_DN52343_c0_g1_i1.p1  ORF type:complete len:374 (+),score=53.91 TRINITY_DN52343_c0_g1_i1:124-1245(+)